MAALLLGLVALNVSSCATPRRTWSRPASPRASTSSDAIRASTSPFVLTRLHPLQHRARPVLGARRRQHDAWSPSLAMVLATVARLPRRHRAALRATGCSSDHLPVPISSSSATSRCCSSCCSGTSACWRPCRRRKRKRQRSSWASRSSTTAACRSRCPDDRDGLRTARSLAIAVLIVDAQIAASPRWAKAPPGRGPARTSRPGWSAFGLVVVLLPIVRPGSSRALATSWDVPDAARLQLPRRLRAGAGVRGPVHGARRPTPRASSPRSCAAASRSVPPAARSMPARALGLRPARIVRLVVIPQAMRVIIPPMTSQYLNLIKNSSFGAAIAYPEIVVGCSWARRSTTPARRSRSSR